MILQVLIISHEVPEIFEISDKVAMLHDERIVEVGISEEIQKSDNIVTKKFYNWNRRRKQ